MVRFSSDTGPVKPISGMWQKAQASLRFTESCLSYSINLPSNSICWTFRRHCKPLDRLGLNTVDLGLDLRNFLQRLRREHCAALLSARRIFVQRGGDYGHCDQQKLALCLHFGASASRR